MADQETSRAANSLKPGKVNVSVPEQVWESPETNYTHLVLDGGHNSLVHKSESNGDLSETAILNKDKAGSGLN